VKNPRVVLIATGSEVSLAIDASKTLSDSGIEVSVVSMPCTSWFDEQSEDYRNQVLPKDIPAIAIEAGATGLWYKYVGKNGRVIGIDQFGASSAPDLLAKELGLTVNAIVEAAKEII
jgi:transketolase